MVVGKSHVLMVAQRTTGRFDPHQGRKKTEL